MYDITQDLWLILRYDYLFHLLYNYKQILGKIAFNIFVKKKKKRKPQIISRIIIVENRLRDSQIFFHNVSTWQRLKLQYSKPKGKRKEFYSKRIKLLFDTSLKLILLYQI